MLILVFNPYIQTYSWSEVWQLDHQLLVMIEALKCSWKPTSTYKDTDIHKFNTTTDQLYNSRFYPRWQRGSGQIDV